MVNPVFHDPLANLSIDSPTGDVVYTSFLFATTIAKAKSKDQLYYEAYLDSVTSAQVAAAIANSAAQRAQVLSNMLAAVAQWRAVYDAQVSQNFSIALYNGSVSLIQQRTDAVNAARTAYINDPSAANSTALTNAINQYNADVGPTVNNYNSTVAPYNTMRATVPSINQKLTVYGVPTISQPGACPTPRSGAGANGTTTVKATIPGSPFPPAALATPIIPMATIPLVTAPPATDQDAIDQYLIGALANFDNSFSLSLLQLLTLSNSRLSLNSDNNLNPVDVTVPYASTKQVRNFLNAGEGIASAGGGGMLAVVAGLSSRILDRILSRALYSTLIAKQTTPLTGAQIEELQVFTLGLLSKSAEAAAAQASRQFAANPVSTGQEQLLDVLSGIAFANSIHDIVSNGTLSKAIGELLRTSPSFSSLTEEQRNALAAPITATTSSLLSQIALSFIGSSIGAPNLVPAVLANVPGAPKSSDLASSNNILPLNDFLDNPAKVVALKDFLKTAVVGVGINENEAEGIVNRVVNNLLAKGLFESIESFLNSVQTGLEAEGVPSNNAAQVANTATNFANNDVNAPYLEQAFNYNITASLIAAPVELQQRAIAPLIRDALLRQTEISRERANEIASDVVKRAIFREDLTQEEIIAALKQGLIKDEVPPRIANQIATNAANTSVSPTPTLADVLGVLPPQASIENVTAALRTTLTTNFNTVRDFRDQFQQNLQTQSFALNDAENIANRVASIFTPPIVTGPASLQPTSRAVSNASLSEAIASFSQGQLAPILGDARTRDVVEGLTHTVFSTQEEIIRSREALRRNGQTEALAQLPETYKESSRIHGHFTNAIADSIKSQPEVVAVYMKPETEGEMRTQGISKQGRVINPIISV